MARCIDWPIWQEKNAAVANTWPQPAEWPAEHYNAACVSFLPTRRRPSSSTIRAIRVISASSPDLTNCNLILEPRKPSSTPHILYSPTSNSRLPLVLPPRRETRLGNQASSMKKLAYSFCRAVRSSLLIELVLGKAIHLGIERSHREPQFSLTFFVDNGTKDWRKTGFFWAGCDST